MTNRTASDALIGHRARMEALIDMLRTHVVDDHMGVSPDEAHWGHVGSAEHASQLLERAAAALGLISHVDVE